MPADAGQSVLEIAEGCGLAIEAGCRMGVCGSDPVAILEGAEHLSDAEDEERSTLRRLGLAPNTRMACCARVQDGAVTVSLTPERGAPERVTDPIDYDRSITSVVVSARASPASPPPTSSDAAIRTARSTWWGRSRTCSTTGWASRASSTAGPR